MSAGPLALSVVIATHDRPEAVERLLRLLAAQTLAAEQFEIIVVDDGSAIPVAARLAPYASRIPLTVVTQVNSGAASARHEGILRSRGEIIVVLDDDMIVGADLLEAHLAEHVPGERRVVLGRVLPAPGISLPLFERFQSKLLDRQAEDVRAGRRTLQGWNLYTGNLSLRREDYLAVGGFDRALRLSEDAELGIRLEKQGCSYHLSERAVSFHASDHASLAGWMRRSVAYGVADSRIADKHPELIGVDPWRYLFLVHPISRPLLLASALAPGFMRAVVQCALWTSRGLAWLGLERAALAGVTLVYGLLYFRGVREHAGTRRNALRGLARHLRGRGDDELGAFGLMMKLIVDVRADHTAMRRADATYDPARTPRSLVGDMVQRIGFQIMVGYRMMRFCRGVGFTLFAKLASRLLRHLYAADIHWDAQLAPGVMIVHGVCLVLSHASRVGPGCVLFHGVTLGVSIHPETRLVGAPTLEAGVHVGPGATLLGPITIGAGTKIMAGVVLIQSVPPQSVVQSPTPIVRTRALRSGVRQIGVTGSSEVVA
jgi:serine acetyltransferase/GT2 family glycosyltransferase